MVVSYVAVEALNAWAMFSRSFYLSCALGAFTETHQRVTITAAPTADHLGLAITRFKVHATPNSLGIWHRRDEPAWHDPNVLITVCNHIGCSIQGHVASSFTMQQTVFRDLPVCRNFFAHRNQSSSRAASNIGPLHTLPSNLCPSDLLLSVSPGASTSVLLNWLDEMNFTAEFMCKA